MAEYIERQKVINITAETGALETQRRIKELPASDVAPVVHAKWNVILSCDDWKIKCSNCGRVFDRFVNGAALPEHCFCGAKMDLEEQK